MRILVTGGAGFIGSHMVCRLLSDGHTVANIDKLTYAGSLDNLGDYRDHPHHVFSKADICDMAAVRSVFHNFKPEAVVHMAAESHVDRSIDSPQDFIETNINGTHNLLRIAYDYWHNAESALKAAFRFIHLSTDEVYGSLTLNEPAFNEDSPYRPNSPYSASKASSDLLVRSYFKTYGLPAIIINTSNNFGPRQFPEKLIPLMILNGLEGKPLPVYGKGEQIRDWLYVKDHIEGLLAALEHGRAGETYCIGGSNEVRNIDFVKTICSLLDQKAPRADGTPYESLITFVKDRPGHDFRYAIDSSKAKRELGWSPRYSLMDALEETVLWYIHEKTKLINLHTRERLGSVTGT